MTRNHTIQVRLSDEEMASITQLASDLDRPISWIVRNRLFSTTTSGAATVSINDIRLKADQFQQATGLMTQMEHTATAPTHRPAPEKPVHEAKLGDMTPEEKARRKEAWGR